MQNSAVAVDPSGFIGAENKVGTYGIDFRDEAKKRFGLSEDTMRYLDRYKYAADLYRKLWEHSHADCLTTDGRG